MNVIFYTGGWIEGATKKDALVLVKAIAEKRLDADAMSWFSIHEYEGGIAYEIYSGGTGESYLGPLLETFKKTPEGQDANGCVQVGERFVRIDKKRPGLTAVLMPENWAPSDPSTILVPSGKCKKIQDSRFLVAIFGICFSALAGAVLYASFEVRRVPFIEPAKTITKPIDFTKQPHMYWDEVSKAALENGVVDKFYLDKDKFKTKHRGSEAEVELELPKAAAAPARGRR